MKINNNDINIDDLLDQKYMHKEIKKGILLTDYQVDVLRKYSINVKESTSIKEIIFLINQVMNEYDDNDDLEAVLKDITEFNYYANTNK
jgi:hypothetical protein